MKPCLDHLEAHVCAALLLAMTLIGFANVVVRYLTDWSFAASEELLLAGFLLMTIFGASMAAQKGQHLAVTFFAEIMGMRANRVLKVFGGAVSLVLLMLTAWFSLDLVRQQLASGVTTPALRLPAWYYSLAMPVGFTLMAIRTVQFTLRDLRDPQGAEAEGYSDV